MNKMDIIKLVFFKLNVDGMNLGAYLAHLDQHEGVLQFLAHGGALNDVIYGYALAGNTLEVNKWLATCDAAQQADCLGCAIRGYAKVGNFDSIYAIKDYKAHIMNTLIGLAQAGLKDKVTAILDRNIALLSAAVEGYASCNQRELLSNLIRGTSFYPLAIYHAARAGHSELVDYLLLQCGFDAEYKVSSALARSTDRDACLLFNQCASGYLAGRHFENAGTMLGRGASIVLSFSVLKDETGLPDYELYLAFLAHIKDKTLRKDVLNHSFIKSAMELLQKNPVEALKRMIKHMDMKQLNYVEVRHGLKNKSPSVIEGAMTLPYLAKVTEESLDKAASSALLHTI